MPTPMPPPAVADYDRAVNWLNCQIALDPTLRPIAEQMYAHAWFPFVIFIAWTQERQLLRTIPQTAPDSNSAEVA